MLGEVEAAQREVGFLLIADMAGSTGSKFLLGDEGAFAALREHSLMSGVYFEPRTRRAAPQVRR